jgi:hypothetical protein
MTSTVISLDLPELVADIRIEADDALSARQAWETRQAMWYKLRHSGLKRPSKPFPGAADMNWPLSDMMIEKIKPYYIQQTFANELVANFHSLASSHQQFNLAAAQWFDARLRQQTNFETEIISVADYMLTSGKGILKIHWSAQKGEVVFDAVDPLFIIVPEGTTTLQESDWVIQVHQMSEASYRRNSLYNQEILDDICTANDAEAERLADAEKCLREGITHTNTKDKVVVWECYVKGDDGKIQVFSVSPSLLDSYVREPMQKPHGDTVFPFVEYNAEIKDKGYYSSRGVPERIAAMQMSMSKLWNEKLDATTVFNRPVFSSDNPMVNAGNIRMVPGAIIPFPVKKVDMGNPPINWDMELNQHRQTAEQLIGVPDAGLSQASSNERRTASEVNLIGSIMSQVVDLRSRVFRNALAETFKQAWEVYVEEDKSDLDYFFQNEMMSLAPEAMNKDYRIEPLASADNLNKQFVFRKKLERFQLLTGHPNVSEPDLVRDLIAADNPQDVKALFVDDNANSQNDAEDQAGEIGRMLIGFPSQIKPVDNDEVHLMTLKQFIERRLSQQEEITKELATLLANHASMHFNQLQGKDKNKAAELGPMLQPMMTILGSIVAEEQAMVQAEQGQPLQPQQ